MKVLVLQSFKSESFNWCDVRYIEKALHFTGLENEALAKVLPLFHLLKMEIRP
jgi:hypothetical protein